MLDGLTFATEFVAVSIAEAREFVRFQEALLATIPSGASSVKAMPSYYRVEDGYPLLVLLEQRIADAAARVVILPNDGFFVKMSDRSPKDSVTEGGRIQRHLSKFTAQCHGEDCSSSASGLPAVYRAYTAAMCVASAREALGLLLESFRTLEDVKLRLELLADGRHKWDLAIAVRRWQSGLDISMEFRCFVCKGRLTVATQYFYDCFFPVLLAHYSAIASLLQSFWKQQLKDRVHYDSYTIDLGLLNVPLELDDHGRTVLSKEQTALSIANPSHWQFPGTPIVIELNPFDAYTDGMLLDWQRHHQLIYGETDVPFSLKITREEQHETKARWWRKLLLSQ